MTCVTFTKVQKATALNSMSLKFSLNEMKHMKAELYKSCIEALKTSPDEKLTEDETFGKTVADTLSHYTGLQKAIAKKKINDVLFELEIGAFMQ